MITWGLRQVKLAVKPPIIRLNGVQIEALGALVTPGFRPLRLEVYMTQENVQGLLKRYDEYGKILAENEGM